jgi:hypothetical protein
MLIELATALEDGTTLTLRFERSSVAAGERLVVEWVPAVVTPAEASPPSCPQCGNLLSLLEDSDGQMFFCRTHGRADLDQL